tara:strand:- start:8139 stop:8417 length:279 start_codon:yes stop_codon:yes gene_type:complete
MINWRSGKAGFVGGLKYAIRGVFQFAHSVTSEAPVVVYSVKFKGYIRESVYGGIPKSASFTGVVKQSAFSGIIIETQFTGVAKETAFSGVFI